MNRNINNVSDIGSLIKTYRKGMGLNQVEAAGLLGVGVRFLSELERGKSTLEIGKVLQVIHGIGLNLIVAKRE